MSSFAPLAGPSVMLGACRRRKIISNPSHAATTAILLELDPLFMLPDTDPLRFVSYIFLKPLTARRANT